MSGSCLGSPWNQGSGYLGDHPGNRIQAARLTQIGSVQQQPPLLQVLVSPLDKLTFKVGASVKDIGPPEALLGSFGPYITGRFSSRVWLASRLIMAACSCRQALPKSFNSSTVQHSQAESCC